MDNQQTGWTPDEFGAFVTLHGGKITGDEEIMTDASGAHRLTFADGSQIEAVENPDGTINVTKWDKLVKPTGSSASPRVVRGAGGALYSENPDGSLTLQQAGTTPNTPRYDQTMPGSGTPGSLGSPLADGPDPSQGWSQGTPDLTVGQYQAQTARQNADTQAANAANTAANDKAGRDAQAASLALQQTQFEYRKGQDAIANALAQGRLSLDQATQAADMLYKQADLELRSRIADQSFGQNMADLEMKRLPAGTLAAAGQGWQSALTGHYTPPSYPVDNRDPTRIALQAIAKMKAGQGGTPAQTALAQGVSGLSLPSAAPQAAGASPGPAFPQPGTPAYLQGAIGQ